MKIKSLPLSLMLVLTTADIQADTLTFQASDFILNPTFSDVQTFEFAIDIDLVITAGTSYVNPLLNGVDYQVSGSLDGTPSGFPAFNLVRSIGGAEFYSQGSSLMFEVDADANLSDGLQVSELVGTGLVFEFNGREVNTGRYHPPLIRLTADGTGSIRNSNNMGGINPVTQMEVDVDFGEEYITELQFRTTTLTLLYVFCDTNEYVSDHSCVACPAGSTNLAGDDPLGDDTMCDGELIFQDSFEIE